MIATQTRYFDVSDDELVQLIERSAEEGYSIDVALGSGQLIWEKGQELPKALEVLRRIRGIPVENTDGAGI